MSKNLFDGSSDSETEINQFTTNREYAKSYNKFREKELMKRLKDLDRNNSSGSSSGEDSESTDEEVVVNKKFDEEFFKTLSSLKSKNPDIYDKNKRFFENISSDNEDNDNKKEKKQKAMTIKDYERQVILEKGGKYVDDDDSDNAEVDDNPRAGSPSYMEEQKKLRSEIKKALASDEEDEEEFGGIFRRREKTKDDKLKEEEEYAVWLAGEKDEIAEDTAKVLNPLKEYWSNPSLPKQEQFLRDYILNNGYQNKDDHEIPTYNEIVGDFSDDEKELEKQAEFELKYNFRYEDPDKEFIKRYPRTIESSVRQKDDRRKEKRLEVKERKEKEKEQKFKELEMLKEIKRREILEKIEKLKEVTGNDELAFKEDELEEDFDPEAHDKRMQAIFNDEYYGVDEGEDKPECPDIDELKVEDWDNYDPEKDVEGGDDDYEPHCEDENFNMDCDYDPQAAKESLQNELIESTKGRRKRGRRNQFTEMIKKEKPVFNPDDMKTYGDYIDEYYKMDCEDMIGDIPCRFKYVETTPNDFGLTIEEILLAKNKELNQWVSLKKAVQIRPAHVELRDKKLYKMKAKNETLKKKIFRSIYGPPSDEEGENEDEIHNVNGTKRKADDTETQSPATKKKKKKSKKRKLESETHTASNSKSETNTETGEKQTTKSESHTTDAVKGSSTEKNADNGDSDDKKKKKKKNKKVNSNPSQQEPQGNANATKQNFKKKKDFNPSNKKRFNGKSQNSETNTANSMSDERLKAYGLNPRKFRKQMQFSGQNPFKNKPIINNKNKFKN